VKGYEVGDSIHGHRIIAEARKISDPVVIPTFRSYASIS